MNALSREELKAVKGGDGMSHYECFNKCMNENMTFCGDNGGPESPCTAYIADTCDSNCRMWEV